MITHLITFQHFYINNCFFLVTSYIHVLKGTTIVVNFEIFLKTRFELTSSQNYLKRLIPNKYCFWCSGEDWKKKWENSIFISILWQDIFSNGSKVPKLVKTHFQKKMDQKRKYTDFFCFFFIRLWLCPNSRKWMPLWCQWFFWMWFRRMLICNGK